MPLRRLISEARRFRDERDWKQFHSARNLSLSLTLEAAELLELFQWKTDAECARLERSAAARARMAEELADVLLYALLMADRLGIDLVAAARGKIKANAVKYPVAQARGTALKYTELAQRRRRAKNATGAARTPAPRRGPRARTTA